MVFEFSRGSEVVATMQAEDVSRALDKYAKALCLDSYDSLNIDYASGKLTVRVFDVPVPGAADESPSS